MDTGIEGVEWLVEAFDCDPASLTDTGALERLLDALISELPLRTVSAAQWHRFPATEAGPGGVTGLCLLAESHFACHTFPEHRSLTINLFCCRPRPDWDFAGYLEREFRARHVCVRKLRRPYGGRS
ncbi:MAG: S-adenosylmethionine decarboxylase [Bryobacteraceae bacterium]